MNKGTQYKRLFSWVTRLDLGMRIECFADLFGTTLSRSNGVMLERAMVCNRVEEEAYRRYE